MCVCSEYGFWREIDSTDCRPNPHAPELDVCDLPLEDRERLHELGYRRIPGDRCVNGWVPPRLNQTIMIRLAVCNETGRLWVSTRFL